MSGPGKLDLDPDDVAHAAVQLRGLKAFLNSNAPEEKKSEARFIQSELSKSPIGVAALASMPAPAMAGTRADLAAAAAAGSSKSSSPAAESPLVTFGKQFSQGALSDFGDELGSLVPLGTYGLTGEAAARAEDAKGIERDYRGIDQREVLRSNIEQDLQKGVGDNPKAALFGGLTGGLTQGVALGPVLGTSAKLANAIRTARTAAPLVVGAVAGLGSAALSGAGSAQPGGRLAGAGEAIKETATSPLALALMAAPSAVSTFMRGGKGQKLAEKLAGRLFGPSQAELADDAAKSAKYLRLGATGGRDYYIKNLVDTFGRKYVEDIADDIEAKGYHLGGSSFTGLSSPQDIARRASADQALAIKALEAANNSASGVKVSVHTIRKKLRDEIANMVASGKRKGSTESVAEARRFLRRYNLMGDNVDDYGWNELLENRRFYDDLAYKSLNGGLGDAGKAAEQRRVAKLYRDVMNNAIDEVGDPELKQRLQKANRDYEIATYAKDMGEGAMQRVKVPADQAASAAAGLNFMNIAQPLSLAPGVYRKMSKAAAAKGRKYDLDAAARQQLKYARQASSSAPRETVAPTLDTLPLTGMVGPGIQQRLDIERRRLAQQRENERNQ